MVRLTVLTALLLLTSAARGLAEDCDISGPPPWSKPLKTVVKGCVFHAFSPDSLITVWIDDKKTEVHFAKGRAFAKAQLVMKPVKTPAMFAWAPNSKAFFINDGQGSATWSAFRFFRIKDEEAVEDGGVGARAVAVWRAMRGCGPEAADPGVWGVSWSPDGAFVDLFIQATAERPCGKPRTFMGLRMRVSDGDFVDLISPADVVSRYKDLVPRKILLHQEAEDKVVEAAKKAKPARRKK